MTADALTSLQEPPQPPGAAGTFGLGFVIMLGASVAGVLALVALMIILPNNEGSASPGASSYELYEAAPRHARDSMEVDWHSNGTVTSATSLAEAVAVLFLAAALARQYGPSRRAFLGLRWPTLRQALAWTAAYFGLRYALLALLDSMDLSTGGERGIDLYRTATFLPLLYLAIVVAVPVMEEILFRGFLLEGWRRSRLGLIGAVVLTALLWAVLHPYDLPVLVVLFCEGILLAIARLHTGSTYLTIGLHAMANLLVLLNAGTFLSSDGTEYFLEKGRRALAQKDHWEASLAFRAAERYSDQPCAECRLGLAQSYLGGREPQRAATAAREVIAMHPAADLLTQAHGVLRVAEPLSRERGGGHLQK